MSVSVGPLRLASPVILAPLSGVTDAPFRRVVQGFGVAMTVSEMVASRAVVENLRRNRAERRKLLRGSGERGPRAVQLAGCEPETMAEAARICVDEGAEIVDINFGCPAKKVVNAYAGSALMADEALAARILTATVCAVAVPVTLKMRTGWRHDRRNAPQIARLAEAAGIALLTVHGRSRDQRFEGRADWGFVAEVKAATGLPLIVNGDIATVDDAQQALALSKADGVMIGRGACGRPWRPAEIAAGLTGRPAPAPPRGAALFDLIARHYDAILTHYGTALGLRLARKHLGWYLAQIDGGEAWRARLLTCGDPRQVLTLLATALIDDGAKAA